MYNTTIRRRENSSASTPKHSRERETPLPILLGTLIHSKTRKRELVDYMFELGLSIPYDRVLAISTMLGNRICHLYNSQGVVCPLQLRRGVFTTSAVDNISSTSAQGSLHGTGISIFQHPDSDCSGTPQPALTPISDADGSNQKLASLPEAYTNVPPATLVKCDPPPKQRPSSGDLQLISQALSKEVKHSWAAYHANSQASTLPHREDSESVAMIRHAMDVVKAAVDEKYCLWSKTKVNSTLNGINGGRYQPREH